MYFYTTKKTYSFHIVKTIKAQIPEEANLVNESCQKTSQFRKVNNQRVMDFSIFIETLCIFLFLIWSSKFSELVQRNTGWLLLDNLKNTM